MYETYEDAYKAAESFVYFYHFGDPEKVIHILEMDGDFTYVAVKDVNDRLNAETLEWMKAQGWAEVHKDKPAEVFIVYYDDNTTIAKVFDSMGKALKYAMTVEMKYGVPMFIAGHTVE